MIRTHRREVTLEAIAQMMPVVVLTLVLPLAGCGSEDRSDEIGTQDLASGDDAFLQKLESTGIDITSSAGADRAIAIAKRACELGAAGYPQNRAINTLIAENSDKPAGQITRTASVGVLFYCPSVLERP
jgi:hypothetical protein